MFNRNMTENAQEIIKIHIDKIGKNNLVALDATVGNGFDLEFLSLLPAVEKVWGFDIQQQAIDITRERVKDIKDKEIYLVKDSHDQLAKYIEVPIDIAMFNLGYLPQGNKTIVTTTETTLEAIKQVIERLTDSGIITIMTYPGHEEGAKEHKMLEKFLAAFSQKNLKVMRLDMINVRKPCPNIFILSK
ncbi:MAG: tRNA (mnm(5)s(2)U34)-methyltransferase [Cellulosilyticaceae bacterium]